MNQTLSRCTHIAALISIGWVQGPTFAEVIDHDPRLLNRLGTEISVMTFNIRYGTANDGANRWQKRRDLVFGVLRRHSPDIVGLQEAFDWQLDEIIAALPQFGFVGVGRNDGVRAGEFAAILYRKNRFRVADHGTFWFSDSPEKPGSMNWGNLIPRICTWARIKPVDRQQPFYVYNVHLDHLSQHSRERSVILLSKRMHARAFPDPVIVTGDFNAGETNPAIRRLVQSAPDTSFRLVDTFRAFHPDELNVGTFNSFYGARNGAKIDYVFGSKGLTVIDAAIIRDNDDGRFPSDHYPVRATLRLH